MVVGGGNGQFMIITQILCVFMGPVRLVHPCQSHYRKSSGVTMKQGPEINHVPRLFPSYLESFPPPPLTNYQLETLTLGTGYGGSEWMDALT